MNFRTSNMNNNLQLSASQHARSIARPSSESAAQALSDLLATLNKALHQTGTRKEWEIFFIVLSFVACVIVPLQGSFMRHSTALWILTYTLDAIFLSELSLSVYKLRSQNTSGNSIQDISPARDGSTHKHHEILVDALSVTPFEIFAFTTSGPERTRLLVILRLNRLLRLSVVLRYFASWELKLNASRAKAQFLKFSMLIVLLAHWQTCLWHGISCSHDSCNNSSWISRISTAAQTTTIRDRYLISLYWSMTTSTSTGYGDIAAQTPVEKIVAVACMVLGVLFFGYLFGSIASSIANSDAPRAMYAEQSRKIQRRFAEESIEGSLRARTQLYFSYVWKRKSGTDCSQLFKDLPLSLQAEIALAAYASMFKHSAVFHSCDEGFLRMLAIKVRTILYLPGERVVQRGHLCDTMFHIYRGSVEVKDSVGRVQAQLREGSNFGEIPMIMGFRNAVETVAIEACDFFVLDKSDVDEVLSHYKGMRHKLVREASQCIESAYRQAESGDGFCAPNPSGAQNNAYCGRTDGIAKEPGEDAEEGRGRMSPTPPMETCSVPRRTWLWTLLFTTKLTPTQYVVKHGAAIAVGALSVWLVLFEAAFTLRTTALNAVLYVLDTVCVVRVMGLHWCRVRAALTSADASFLLATDVVANVPWELLLFVAGVPTWQTLCLARLPRVLRCVRIHRDFTAVETRTPVKATAVRAACLVVVGVLAAQACACTWVLVDGAAGQADASATLVAAVYWTMATTTSTGYGDIHPQTNTQRIVAVVVMVMGQAVFGVISATIAATLANNAKSRIKAQSHLTAVSRFLRDHAITKRLQTRVTAHFGNSWIKYEGLADSDALAHTLPRSLQAELGVAQYGFLLSRFPLLHNVPPAITNEIVLRMNRVFVLPNESIVTKGDIGKNMFFILQGTVDVLTDDGRAAAQLVTGQYFGEIGMLFGTPRLNAVRAATHCELVTLARADLEEAARHYPAFQQTIRHLSSQHGHLKAVEQAVALNDLVGVAVPLRQTNVNKAKQDSTLLHSNTLRRHNRNRISATGLLPAAYNDSDTELRNVGCCAHSCLLCIAFPWTLNPMSSWAARWETTQVLLAMVVAVTVPFQAAFCPSATWLYVLHYLVDAVFVLDLLVKLHTAFFDARGVLVYNSQLTAYHYLRRGFAFDCFTVLPFEVIASLCHASTTVIAVCRFNRICRCYKINQYFAHAERTVGVTTTSNTYAKFSLLALLALNFMASLWALASTVEDGTEDSWVSNTKYAGQHASALHTYVMALYWSTATMTSVGYGDVHAHTVFEMGLATMTMLLGTLFYSFFLGSSAASLANADFQRSRYQERLDGVLRYLHSAQTMDKTVIQRVSNYYEYVWMRNRGMKPKTLIQDLPQALLADLCMEVYRGALETVPLFRDVDVGFMRLLSSVMQPIFFQAGEYIVRKGDIGQEMFIIHKGAVDVVSEDGSQVFATMAEGAIFGEISLFKNCPRTASIRSKGNCDLFVLSKQDLDEVLQSFPDVGSKIMQEAALRFEKVQERQRQGGQQPATPAPPAAGGSTSEGPQRPAGITINVADNDTAADPGSKIDPGTKPAAITVEDTGGTAALGVQGPSSANDDDAGSATPTAPCIHVSDTATDSGTSNAHAVRHNPSSQTCSKDAEDNAGTAESGVKEVPTPPPKNESTKSVPPSTKAPSDAPPDAADTDRMEVSRLAACCFVLIQPVRALLRGLGGATTLWRKDALRRHLANTFFVMALVLCITVPYELAFKGGDMWIFGPLNIALECVFFLEAGVKMCTVVELENGAVITQGEKIVQHYISHSTFVRDAVALFPLDWIVFLFCPQFYWPARAVKLIRTMTIEDYFTKWAEDLEAPIMLIRLLRCVIVILLTAHGVACGWFLVSCPHNCTNTGWVGISDNADSTSDHHYVNALYWAMATMTTTGYGDFHAHNDSERLFAIAAMLGGKVLFGMVLGNIASTQANADYQRVQYKDKMLAVHSFFHDRLIPQTIRSRIVTYYEYLWTIQRGLNPSALFEDVPYTLRADISWNICQDQLSRVPIFRQTDSGFMAMLGMQLQPEYFLCGDWAAKAGDICRQIVFVSKGYIEVLSNSRVVQVKHPGSYFGDIEVLHGAPYGESYRAATDAEVLVLPGEKLEATLAFFPKIKAQLDQHRKNGRMTRR